MGSFFLIIMFALQYMFIQIGSKTAKRYFKNVEEQVIQRQSKVWSNL